MVDEDDASGERESDSAVPVGCRIAVVEDEPTVSRTLERSLESRGFEVTVFGSAEALLASSDGLAFNAYLVDIGLPGMDGFTLIRALRAKGVRNPIVVMSARGELDAKLTALDGGADDYVVKGPVDLREVHARLIAQLRRGLRAPEPSARETVTLVERESALYVRGRPVELTPVELRILSSLARAHGAIVNGAELAQRVWDGPEDRRRSLESHVSNLRRKLKREAWRLVTVSGDGYRLLDVDVVPELPIS